MILQKVLAAGRSTAIKKVVSPTADVMAIARRNKVIATPPTVKISKGEKYFISIMMPLAILSVPTWIVFHLREYGGAAE